MSEQFRKVGRRQYDRGGGFLRIYCYVNFFTVSEILHITYILKIMSQGYFIADILSAVSPPTAFSSTLDSGGII